MNQATKNIIFVLINRVIHLLCPFFLRMEIVKILGIEYVGLQGLCISLLQALALAELGFGSVLSYFLYGAIAKNDYIEIKAYVLYTKKIFFIIGIFILISSILVSVFVPEIIGNNDLDINASLVFLLFGINSSLSYLTYGYKQVLLSASRREDLISAVSAVVYILLFILQILSLEIFKSFYIFIILMICGTIGSNVVISKICDEKFGIFLHKIKYASLSEGQLCSIKRKILALIGHRFAGTIVRSSDNIVMSFFLGLNIVGIYSNFQMILLAMSSLCSILNLSLTAIVGNNVITKSTKENQETFLEILNKYGLIVVFFSLGYILFSRDFVSLWIGRDYLFEQYTVVFLGCQLFISNIRQVLLMYKDALGMWEKDKAKPYVEAITNLLLNCLLIHFYGVNGVILATLISIAFIAIPWETSVVYKFYFKKGVGKYIYLITIQLLLGFASTYVYLWLKDIHTPLDNECLNFLVNIVLFSTIYIGVSIGYLWIKKK